MAADDVSAAIGGAHCSWRFELVRELALDEVDEKPQQQHGHERDAADDFQPARRLDDEVAGDLLIRGHGWVSRFVGAYPGAQNCASVVSGSPWLRCGPDGIVSRTAGFL